MRDKLSNPRANAGASHTGTDTRTHTAADACTHAQTNPLSNPSTDRVTNTRANPCALQSRAV